MRAAGVRCLAAHPRTDSRSLSQVDFTADCCVVFGSEGYGLSDAVLAACDEAVAVPMASGVDSLNVGSAAAAFSTDCTLCHNTTSFAGATYTQHDTLYFPIYSGKHLGRWSRCSDCHTNASNYGSFSCLGCHSAADTDPRHTGVSGYVYDSAACYSCHPRGSAGN